MPSIIQAIAERQNKLIGATKSANGFHVPAFMRNYAYLKEGRIGYNDSLAEVMEIDKSRMKAKFVVSTVDQDRDGDIVIPRACIPYLANYQRNPVVFFGHQQFPLPIASSTSPDGEFTFSPEDERISSWAFFHGKTPESNQVFHLVAEKQLNTASLGFNPLEAERLPHRKDAGYYEMDDRSGKRPLSGLPGWLFKLIDVIEWSVVGIPANSEAIAIGLSKGLINGDRVSPALAKALKPYAIPMSGVQRGGYSPSKGGGLVLKGLTKTTKLVPAPKTVKVKKSIDRDQVWAKQLQQSRLKMSGPRPAVFDQYGIKAPFEQDVEFNVATERADPSSKMIDWVSKYLKVPVKKIFQTNDFIPTVRMGTFLTGLEKTLKVQGFEREDVRKLQYNGGEIPPNYESIRLNSKTVNSFLTDGTGFYRGPMNLVLDFQRDWGGIGLSVYAPLDSSAKAMNVLTATKEWAAANNFLKGEKFALSGEFLEKTAEDWDDLFLEKENIDALHQTVNRLNLKGKSFSNHGTVASGPPGTGKTKSVRILMNKANATFIWVSARDFHHFGSFSGMTSAFDLAKELAPSIVVFEDCDNWMNDHSIDFVKSEMDGVARYKGVWTILTTNFPERLPEALIDRPGRFHDVLQFALPTPDARKQMLKKWVPGISNTGLTKALESTQEYSGAHMFHLSEFAKNLQEAEGLDIDTAVELALTKVRQQKELITGIQLEGSRYRPRKQAVLPVIKRFGKKDLLPGGIGDNRPDSDFDAEQLKIGIKIEMEHTDDPAKAKEIAKDHLTEDADYYRKLTAMVETEKCNKGFVRYD